MWHSKSEPAAAADSQRWNSQPVHLHTTPLIPPYCCCCCLLCCTVSFRLRQSNFAVQDSVGVIRLRRADRAFHAWGTELCPFLTSSCRLPSFPDVAVSFRYATEHRCAVVLRGPNLSDCITGTDPLVDGRLLLQCRPTVPSEHAEYEAAQRTSSVVNELSSVVAQLLSAHPLIVQRHREGLPITNIVLLRGAGKRIHVPRFTWPPTVAAAEATTAEQGHASSQAVQQPDDEDELPGLKGSTAFVLAPTAIIGGLALSLSMRRVECVGATGDYRTDLNAKAEEAARCITSGRHSFGLLHVKVATQHTTPTNTTTA